jgi:peptidoglycan hydrolase-like protein with peptidoglycan-binding domain
MRSLIAFMFIAILAVSGAQSVRADQRTEEAQARLSELGYEVTVDGVFGEGTERAVRKFQRDRGLNVTGDLNSDTREALFKEGGNEGGGNNEGTANSNKVGNMQCRDSVTATGYRRIGEGRAKSSAERAWSNKVATLNGYGLAYTDLKLAKEQQVVCIKACAECTVSKVCTITADPCRPNTD